MNEKYPVTDVTNEGTPNNLNENTDGQKKHKGKLGIYWFALLTTLTLSSCGDKISEKRDNRRYKKDPIAREIKQQEKIDNLEADLKWVKHQKEEKIKQRKPIVKNYVDKMKEYEEGGKQNKALQNKLYQLSKDINEYNNEIISLSKKQAALEKELNHKQSKTSNEMPNWNPLTDPDYFDFEFELDDENTANYFDYVEDEF